MNIQGTIPQQTVSQEYRDQTLQAAVADFLSRHPKARLESIDGKFVKGLSFCGIPVFEGDTGYQYDFDEQRFRCPDSDCTTCKQG